MSGLRFKLYEYQQCEGLRIKFLRLKRGWVQEKLAAECDCQKSLISAIEHGKNINKITELKICRALETEPWDLYRMDDNWKDLFAITDQMQKDQDDKARAERRRKKKKD